MEPPQKFIWRCRVRKIPRALRPGSLLRELLGSGRPAPETRWVGPEEHQSLAWSPHALVHACNGPPKITCVPTLREQAVGKGKNSDLSGENLAILGGTHMEQTYGVPALVTGT